MQLLPEEGSSRGLNLAAAMLGANALAWHTRASAKIRVLIMDGLGPDGWNRSQWGGSESQNFESNETTT